MSATLSLLGLYQWDDTILNNLVLPDGVDLDLMKKTLLRECAELEILYSNPEFLKEAIGIWSSTELQTWQRLQEAFTISYNPIWNVDGFEEEIEEHNLKLDANGETSNINQVSGYNSNSMQPNENDIGTSNMTTSDTGTLTRRKTRGGNIGVTTSTKMLSEEYTIRPKLNIYRYITDDFKNRFCLLIY